MVKGEGERERTIENSHWLVRGPVYKKHLGEFYLHLPISVECQWRSGGENRCKTALVLKGTTFRHHCLNKSYTNMDSATPFLQSHFVHTKPLLKRILILH